MKTRTFLKGSACAIGLALAHPLALSQSGRPVRIVVPLPAGTATDLAARVLAQSMGASLGMSFVVDNKPGANGAIGVMDMVRAQPDGHTLLIGSNSPLATNMALVKNLQYDPRRDFSAVAGFGHTMHALMVKPSFPVKTMPEFIAYARQRPGKVSVGTSTSAVTVQIATLNKLAGIDLLTVPYKGIPATITDVIGGSLDATLVDLANAMAQAKSGALRTIAVTSLRRNPLVPDWPAISETLSGFDFPSWVAMVGPANMPRELVERYNTAANAALKQPEVLDRLATIGMAPMVVTPEQLRTYIASETSRWIQLARDANVQPE